jgi:hypothetical protein
VIPVLLSNGHFYDEAEATCRRMAREYQIEHATYVPLPNHQFAPCPYCPGAQDDATISFNWGTGSGESCPHWDHAHAVLDEALEKAYPENISVCHPVISLPKALPEAS